MTLRRLIKSCEKHALYRTPEVNDKLYCHYEGYREIDGEVMARYANIKCLWLQGNGLSEIKGLDGCEKLTSLYLHENCINEIGEGLRKLVALDTLNLSKTFVKVVGGLAQCEKLTTLNLGYCSLGPGADAIVHCESLPKLATLDIQHNRLEDGEGVLDVATKMPALRVLYCQGNPFVKGFKYYRKRFIGGAAEMRYLDDRPVFEDEARRTKAWAAGVEEGGYERGNEAEREMIKTLRDEKKAYDDNRHNDFMKLMHEGQAIRRAREEQAAAAALSAEMAAAGAGTPTDAASAALAAAAGGGAAGSTNPNPFAQLNPMSDVLAAKGKPRGVLDPPPAPPAGGGATVNPFSGEAIIDVPESDSITAARDARRAALDAAGFHPPVGADDDDDDDDAPPALEGADVPPPPPPRGAAGPATDADDADAAWRQELAEEAAEEARWTARAGGHVGADDEDHELPPTEAEATFAMLEENNAGHATFEEAYAAAAADAAAEDAASAVSAASLPVASPACDDDDDGLPPVAAVAAPPVAPGSVKAVPVVPGEPAQPPPAAAVVMPPPPPPSGATDFFELD